MKALKTVFLVLSSIIVVSCFDSPEFSNVPSIEFEDIYFAKNARNHDSLVVVFKFEDGDGDLGLGPDLVFPGDINDPFHDYDFYLGNGSEIIQTVTNQITDRTSFLRVPDNATGKLVRYGDLPDMPAESCENYVNTTLYVRPEHAKIFDESYNVTAVSEPNGPTLYYEVEGSFYAKANPYHHNFVVSFFRRSGDEYVEYKWPFCESYNGRFERLTDKTGALSGTMKYTMSSINGLTSTFGTNRWKLRFFVYDRRKNKSNEVETQEFSLPEITR